MREHTEVPKTGGIRRRALLWCISVLLFWLQASFPAYADEPAAGLTAEMLTAESAVVVDADSGAVLFGKNEEWKEYPASITKVMTALVVLDHCSMDDKVTFSHDAVYNVDKGSSNAQIEEGDVLSVEDCLHALLLKSANEAANALAEHVAGSRAAFAELMNEEARRLGCRNTHFSNPSGLYADDHYTTALDMARIGTAAMNNPAFLEIESHLSWKMQPTIRVPEGKTVYMEHKMLLNTKYYDERVIAGKTGYTIVCGNTLVTMAESGGQRLVAVVLKDKNPAHYVDTRALLDYGFSMYERQLLGEGVIDLGTIRDRLVADTVVTGSCSTDELRIDDEIYLTLPAGASQEGVEYRLNYNLPEGHPEQAVAELLFTFQGQPAGQAYVLKTSSVLVNGSPAAPDGTEKDRRSEIALSGQTVAIGLGLFVLLLLLLFFVKGRLDSARQKKARIERRQQRLREMDMTEEEFKALVDRKWHQSKSHTEEGAEAAETEKAPASQDVQDAENDPEASGDGQNFLSERMDGDKISDVCIKQTEPADSGSEKEDSL